MSEESLNHAVRRAKRSRGLGPNASCSACGVTTPAALKKYKGIVLCYECRAAQQGKTTVEQHHLLGQANDSTTIGLPGTIHREVSDRRYDWPEQVRANPARDPLIWAAGLCYSVRDLCGCLAAWLERAGGWLLALAEILSALFGVMWWDALGINTLWGEASA